MWLSSEDNPTANIGGYCPSITIDKFDAGESEVARWIHDISNAWLFGHIATKYT